jgi:uncharacterized protein (TIGR02246 family)
VRRLGISIAMAVVAGIGAVVPAMGQTRSAEAADAVASNSVESVTVSDVQRAKDKWEFDRLLAQQERSWVVESGAMFADTFHQDADVVTFNGDHLRTREGIAAGMQRYFDNYIENTSIRTLGERIRYVEPDMAVIIRTSCLITAPATTCRDDSYSINTNVMHRRHGQWLQTAFQNTRTQPLP